MLNKDTILSEYTDFPKGDSSIQSLSDVERKVILDALEKCLWVQKNAAEKLGITRRVLNYRIKKLGIKHPRWRKNI